MRACLFVRRLFAGAERCSRESQMALNPRCGRVRTAEHAPRDRFYRWQASLQYLVLHLLHLFLWSWASGAAQAAQFVRIILVF